MPTLFGIIFLSLSSLVNVAAAQNYVKVNVLDCKMRVGDEAPEFTTLKLEKMTNGNYQLMFAQNPNVALTRYFGDLNCIFDESDKSQFLCVDSNPQKNVRVWSRKVSTTEISSGDLPPQIQTRYENSASWNNADIVSPPPSEFYNTHYDGCEAVI